MDLAKGTHKTSVIISSSATAISICTNRGREPRFRITNDSASLT